MFWQEESDGLKLWQPQVFYRINIKALYSNQGFRGMANFIAQNTYLRYFTQNFTFESFCALNGTSFAQYSAMFHITQNKFCEKLIAQIATVRKILCIQKQNCAKLNPGVKTKL